MAALVFRAYLEREGLADVVRVSSAGIGGWHAGEPADERAQATLRAHGYRSEHLAAEVDGEHLDADLLLAADDTHLRFLRAKLADPDRAQLLRAFDPASARDAEVPDPYYGADNGFEEVLAMIERSMPGLVLWVRENR
ncbi:MAG: low molecular weight protein-tyrosine phosphatase [Actinomycetota bacterium]|jgi:protein-tyrosine phosphatase|nr:low molecular weight protein-tyrosine phosphatase [Actinomycetota bacterium]